MRRRHRLGDGWYGYGDGKLGGGRYGDGRLIGRRLGGGRLAAGNTRRVRNGGGRLVGGWYGYKR